MQGRKLGSVQNVINWEVIYFNEETKVFRHEKFKTVSQILRHPEFNWLTRGKIDSYQNWNGNSKNIWIKYIGQPRKKYIKNNQQIEDTQIFNNCE